MKRRFFACIPLLATLGVAACGSDEVHNKDFGTPPDAGGFDPGQGGGGDGYGSGGNAGGGDVDGGSHPFVCPEDSRLCARDFTLPYNGENTVELRGNYRDDGWTKGDPMVKSGNTWRVTVQVPYDKPVQYKFVINGSNWINDPNNPNTVDDGNGGKNSVTDKYECTNFTCAEPPVPPAGVFDWRDSVIYFVFVDRFFDGDPSNNCHVAGASKSGTYNGDYVGGDWKGVTQKIDGGYFTDLGVNTLWITVPFKNADNFLGIGNNPDNHEYTAYHGYWPNDPGPGTPIHQEDCFGSMDDLKGMVTAAHAKGIKILFDYAMVHVQTDSPVFKNHADWFWPNQNPDNGGNCICNNGNDACSWNNGYQRCWFAPYLAHWNYTNADARNYQVGNAVEWAKEAGIDGFRLDAIKHVDTSWLTQLRTTIQQQIVPLQTPQQRFYMVGETFEYNNRDFIKSFVDPSTKLDGQFDFPMRGQVVGAVIGRQEKMSDLASWMDGNENYYGLNAVMSTFIGNHDMGRIIEEGLDQPMWGPYDSGGDASWQNQPQLPTSRAPFERVANGFAVLLTNKGAPLIYYGDEIGMPGASDPDNRRPMQWSGLSSDQQYLHDRIKTLTAIRAAHPALRRGHRSTIGTPTADVWAYEMTTSGDTVYVVVNRGDSDQSVSGLPSGALNELVTSQSANGPTVTVPARQTRIYAAP